MMLVIASIIYDSEIFKSNIILDATLKDDLYHYQLKFRENGTVSNEIQGMFGYKDNFRGTYHLKGNLIIFIKKPYKNNFIPDTLWIDKNQNALFRTKSNGEFDRTKFSKSF
jgi:hypothetical protein